MVIPNPKPSISLVLAAGNKVNHNTLQCLKYSMHIDKCAILTYSMLVSKLVISFS